VITDAPRDHYGNGESHSPSDLLSVSLGSCILSVMGIAARSMDIDIAGASATVAKHMANAPRRIDRIAVEVRVPGNFDEGQKARLEPPPVPARSTMRCASRPRSPSSGISYPAIASSWLAVSK
jgi:hypothetical protein